MSATGGWWRMALWIGGLGALGSLARAGLGFALARALGGHAWLPTLAINLLGSFGMGLAVAVLGSVSDPLSRHPYSLGITAGFLGGFTTYSAFAYQSYDLAEKRAYGALGAYLSLTVVGCLVACAAGVALGRVLVR
jgi:CrcB protein